MTSKTNQVHSAFSCENDHKSSVVPSYKPANERWQRIKNEWDRFIGSCTLHGLHYFFERDRSRLQRLLWLIFILSGVGWFGYQSSLLFIKYYSFPIQTKAMLVYESNPIFPAVTICNFCSYKKSKVKELYKEILNISYSLQTESELSGNSSNQTVWDHFNLTGLNMTDTYITSGFQMEDFLVGCKWSNSPCSAKNFTAMLTGFGLCYTFNSGR